MWNRKLDIALLESRSIKQARWRFEPTFVVKGPGPVFVTSVDNLGCNKRSYVISCRVMDRVDWIRQRVALGRKNAKEATKLLAGHRASFACIDRLVLRVAAFGVSGVWKEAFSHDRYVLQRLEDAEHDALLMRSC